MNVQLMYLGIILLIWAIIFWNKAVVSSDEYLDLLSYEWKDGREIHCELERLKKGWVSIPEFYSAMQRLVDDGLAEIKIEVEIVGEIKISVAYYKKKAGGSRNDEEIESLPENILAT